MKRSITLGHADVVTAISAYLVEQGMGEVNEVNFHLDSEGQVTAVAIESEAKASTGRASRTTQKDAVVEEEKPAGRSRRGTKTEDADDKSEDADATTSTRSRRGSRGATAEETPATTGRASRGSRKPATPTVPEKSEDDYNLGAGETDENVTYWVNLDDESEVFAVPAGQELPDSEQYEEIGSEAEALERITANGDNAEEVQAEEEAPATTGRTRRTRGAATEEKAEPATTGRTRRGAAAAQDTAPAETSARRPRLLRKS